MGQDARVQHVWIRNDHMVRAPNSSPLRDRGIAIICVTADTCIQRIHKPSKLVHLILG